MEKRIRMLQMIQDDLMALEKSRNIWVISFIKKRRLNQLKEDWILLAGAEYPKVKLDGSKAVASLGLYLKNNKRMMEGKVHQEQIRLRRDSVAINPSYTPPSLDRILERTGEELRLKKLLTEKNNSDVVNPYRKRF